MASRKSINAPPINSDLATLSSPSLIFSNPNSSSNQPPPTSILSPPPPPIPIQTPPPS
ncbi:hypothetical protein GBA52_004822 [Prunus armeniaca]|nr:hypothetical protein GBA52_004822 [Prunus armeniaca]